MVPAGFFAISLVSYMGRKNYGLPNPARIVLTLAQSFNYLLTALKHW